MHGRSKHIDIHHHFLREHIENEDIDLEYINTSEMIADVLTKPLTAEKHRVNTLRLGLKVSEWIHWVGVLEIVVHPFCDFVTAIYLLISILSSLFIGIIIYIFGNILFICNDILFFFFG